MSNQRPNDKYPEHLNPFKRLGLRGSFRELKRNFDIKIRRKEPKKIPKEDQVHGTDGLANQERLSESDVLTLRRDGVSQMHTSEIYPRSRFSERANKAKTLTPSSGENPFGEDIHQEQNNNNRKSDNPFNDESSETAKPTEVDAAKTTTGKRYRRKKRAPLPPNRLGVNTMDHHQSQWSISSYETDCSSTAYNSETTHEDHEYDVNDSAKGLDDIHEISKEIINYCTTVNETTNVSENGINANPEIVVSDETESREIYKVTVNDEVSDINNKVDIDTNSHNEVTPLCANENNPEDSIDKSDECIAADTSRGIIEQGNNAEHDQNGTIHKPFDEKSNILEGKVEISEPVCKDSNIEEEPAKNSSDVINGPRGMTSNISEELDKQLSITDDATSNDHEGTKNVVSEERVEQDNALEVVDTLVHNNSACNLQEEALKNVEDEDAHINGNDSNNFVETKSIYISGSIDNLDSPGTILYKEKTAIYLTGSRDELCANPNGAETIEIPTPKLRKPKFKESPIND